MLAHELSHVAHRDVLVMTLAASAGHRRRDGSPAAPSSAALGGGRPQQRQRRRDRLHRRLVVSLVVYAISFLLTAAALALPRALRRPLRRLPDPEARRRWPRRCTKISGEMNAVPERDLRAAQPMNAFFIAPAISGLSLETLTSTHPPLEQRLDQLAKIAAEPRRQTLLTADGSLGRAARAARRPRAANLDALFSLPSAAITLEAALGPAADRRRRRSASAPPRARRSRSTQQRGGRRCSTSTAGPDVESRVDEYGFTWLTVRTDPADVGRAGHRPARRQLLARGPGLRARPALLAGRLPRDDGGRGVRSSTSTSRAPSTRSARPARAARQPAGAPGPRRRRRRPADRGGHLALDADLGDPQD